MPQELEWPAVFATLTGRHLSPHDAAMWHRELTREITCDDTDICNAIRAAMSPECRDRYRQHRHDDYDVTHLRLWLCLWRGNKLIRHRLSRKPWSNAASAEINRRLSELDSHRADLSWLLAHFWQLSEPCLDDTISPQEGCDIGKYLKQKLLAIPEFADAYKNHLDAQIAASPKCPTINKNGLRAVSGDTGTAYRELEPPRPRSVRNMPTPETINDAFDLAEQPNS